MTERWKGRWQGFGWGVVVMVAGLILLGAYLAELPNPYKQAAIKRGYAHYICDPETGEIVFQWKESQK